MTQSNFYDVANPASISIASPEIALYPSSCFAITDYDIKIINGKAYDDLSAFIAIAKDRLSFRVKTSEHLYVGFYEFAIKAITNSGEQL